MARGFVDVKRVFYPAELSDATSIISDLRQKPLITMISSRLEVTMGLEESLELLKSVKVNHNN